jgi:hypothetical protein
MGKKSRRMIGAGLESLGGSLMDLYYDKQRTTRSDNRDKAYDERQKRRLAREDTKATAKTASDKEKATATRKQWELDRDEKRTFEKERYDKRHPAKFPDKPSSDSEWLEMPDNPKKQQKYTWQKNKKEKTWEYKPMFTKDGRAVTRKMPSKGGGMTPEEWDRRERFKTSATRETKRKEREYTAGEERAEGEISDKKYAGKMYRLRKQRTKNAPQKPINKMSIEELKAEELRLESGG